MIYLFNLFSRDQVSFNWGSSAATPSGQGPVSVRWEGKLLAPASETFTLFVRAHGDVRLFVDHVVVIDAWAGTCSLRVYGCFGKKGAVSRPFRTANIILHYL